MKAIIGAGVWWMCWSGVQQCAPNSDALLLTSRLQEVAAPARESLRATMPEGPVGLGQPLRITVNYGSGKIVAMGAVQTTSDPPTAYTNERKDYSTDGIMRGQLADDGTSKVVSDDGSTMVIEIIPLQIGKVELELAARFADGELSQAKYTLNVEPSSRDLQFFGANQAFSVCVVTLGSGPEDGYSWLQPQVAYRGLKYPIYLPNSSSLRFDLEQPWNDPVFEISKVGKVHGMRVGSGYVTAHFADATSRIKVIVKPAGGE